MMSGKRLFARVALLLLGFGLAAPAQALDRARGARLYQMHCAMCHGPQGVAVMPGAPNFRYQERLQKQDFELLDAVRSGRGAMPPFFGRLSEQEILDILFFIRSM
jgi:cytochrome c6